jgi:hypothetical protein
MKALQSIIKKDEKSLPKDLLMKNAELKKSMLEVENAQKRLDMKLKLKEERAKRGSKEDL